MKNLAWLTARFLSSVLFLSVLPGCSIPIIDARHFPGHTHVTKIEPNQNGSSARGESKLETCDNETTFDLVAADYLIPTVLAHPGKCLRFSLTEKHLQAGSKIEFKETKAICIGIDGYTTGDGVIDQGSITVEKISKGYITLTIDSAQLDKRLRGKHLFSSGTFKDGKRHSVLEGWIDPRNPILTE